MIRQSPRPQSAPGSTTAHVFRGIGVCLLLIGLVAMAAGLVAVGTKTGSFIGFDAGMGCLFWSALMYAIAEVLTRLAEISEAVRKQADRPAP